jgi:tetratricopeptide (TPR) repeat protein
MISAFPSRVPTALLFWVAVFLLTTAAQNDDACLRAMARFRAGDFANAIALFAGAERNSPGATDALLYKSRALINLQRFPEADKELRQYLKTHVNAADALYLLGFVLDRENKPEESLKVYTEPAAIRQPDGDDLKIVGLNAVLLNDYSDAIKWLEKRLPSNRKTRMQGITSGGLITRAASSLTLRKPFQRSCS